MASGHFAYAARRLVAVARHGSTPSAGLLSGGITFILAAIVFYAFNDKLERNTDRSKGLAALQNVPMHKLLIIVEVLFLTLGIGVTVVSFFVRNR